MIFYRHRAMNDGQIENIDLVAQSITTVKTILEERLDVNLHEVAIAAAGRALQTKKITIGHYFKKASDDFLHFTFVCLSSVYILYDIAINSNSFGSRVGLPHAGRKTRSFGS